MDEKKYSEKEVRKIVQEEVNTATKNKSYSYSKWVIDDSIAKVLGIIVLIIIIAILAFIFPTE